MLDETRGPIHVTQPNIERWHNELSNAWATQPRYYGEWVRYVAPQLDIDTQKVILGYSLKILHDDANCFAWEIYAGMFIDDPNYSLTGRREAQTQIRERLEWEVATPELPEQFRQLLQPILRQVQESDWTNEAIYKQVSSDWRNINAKLLKEISDTADYLTAIEYCNLQDKRLRPYYNEFTKQ